MPAGRFVSSRISNATDQRRLTDPDRGPPGSWRPSGMVQSIVMAMVLVAVQCVKASAGGPQLEFSATSQMEVNGVTVTELVYSAPGMLRRDLEVGQGRQIEITRWDKKVAWLLMTDDKLYLERPLLPADDRTPYMISLQQTSVGQEPLNGIMTTKFRASHQEADGTTLNGFVWTTQEGITVKMDLTSDTTPPVRLQMELTKLNIGRQDKHLFEIPRGFHKLSLGSAGTGSSP